MNRRNHTEKFWDRLAGQFDKQSGRFEHPPSEKALEFLNVNDTVLDYGCATGSVTIALAAKVKEIIGIDISSRMIDAAKRKASEQKIENINFIHGTIDDESLKPESLNAIIAFNVLHFSKDTQKVLHRINDLLSPGGLVIIASFCLGQNLSNTFLFLIFSSLIKLGIIPFMKFFKISELTDSISAEKFQITELVNLSNSNYFIVAKKVH
jgi:2-polyprenyl-3-methyl-5-hydroxy-6-metoxy-1,4-benzoquinol methylase